MSRRGAKVVVSNSDPKNADENDNFFDKLYIGSRIKRVSATRMINCNGNRRGAISELLISNF
jgi:DNA adenine methylase